MNNPESPEKITSFRGAQITRLEADALRELEKLATWLTNRQFTKVNEVGLRTKMGFSTENQRVIGIGLWECGISTLPESIGNLKSLTYLSLMDNKLTTLPESIGNLSSLKELYLDYNKLTTLPESIGNHSSLKELYLGYNELTTLPESITKLESLQELSLGDNQLSTLPESIGNLKSLEKLYLYRNLLSTLPESISNLKSLAYLGLSSNKLTTLPESIGNLTSLEKLELYNNQLKNLPESTVNYTYLQKLKGDTFKTNSFTQEFMDKCKAAALTGAPHEKEFFMKIVELLEPVVPKPSLKEKIKNYVKENYRSFAYAGSIALVGLFTFLVLGLLLQSINPVIIWTFFIGALAINLLIGASIIATLSGYFKKYIERGIKAIKSTSSERLDRFGDWIRRRLFGLFDVFVLFYLIWTIRAAVKTGLNVELIPAVNFAFEYAIPLWLLNFWALFGYNVKLSFLENLDLFLGHFYLKLFGVALAFWALYRYGFEYIRKTAFDKIENKNIRPFIVLGLFGAFSLAIMEHSDLKQFLSIGYSVGAIIGCCLFTWEINKDNPFAFFIYLILIGGGILVVWLLSLWNLIVSVVIGAVFVISFFVVRWRIETSKIYITYEITAEQNKAMKDLQRTLKKHIPPVVKVGYDTFGVKIEGDDVVELGLYDCGIIALPESIGNLSSLQKLWLQGNELTTLPESIENLSSLKELYLYSNQLTTLPESIGNLSSLNVLYLYKNELTTLPESIGNLKTLQTLWLQENKLTTLPESIGNMKSLQTLNLENNKLSTLPESIGNLSSLNELYLGYNKVTTLSESIGNLKSLQTLELQFNKLSIFPESITKLESLQTLNLDDNQLTTLPESIGNLSSLEKLWLFKNQLTTLPESISSLKSLQTLYLSGNKLSTLPESIKTLERRGVKIHNLAQRTEK